MTPLIRRVVARNPSPFTFKGTGTYIVGHGKVAVIDPGPDISAHVEALLAALRGETVTHILVTHTHLDHSPAAAAIKQATGAKTYGFGPHGSGRDEDRTGVGGVTEEGGDRDFVPDVVMRDGDAVAGPGWRLAAVHTPGHTSNHLCFALPQERTLFSGDHVMGWSTSVIAPPDGDMAAYMRSLDKLLSARRRRLLADARPGDPRSAAPSSGPSSPIATSAPTRSCSAWRRAMRRSRRSSRRSMSDSIRASKAPRRARCWRISSSWSTTAKSLATARRRSTRAIDWHADRLPTRPAFLCPSARF